ncbi:MAG: type II toxin-antitoxin system PemK/MazF family toxin [Candidatus Magasanikbacteria bacterium]|nr:type II toxin-antitoxin system PemK/MazF family toxin [Candidatus Magasanikbacteria bacterium]
MERMIKKFIAWTRLKIKINVTERVFYFREGEIWWASLGANIGHEEDGKNDNFERPVVVLKKFNQYVLWALPLTSQIKEGNRYYYKYELNGKQFSAVLSQLRLISSKRLLRRVANLSIIGLSPNALL